MEHQVILLGKKLERKKKQLERVSSRRNKMTLKWYLMVLMIVFVLFQWK